MEKIIAVVIMIVIVIGLIATVVMPQSQQTADLGQKASEQTNKISASISGTSGADVKNELARNDADANYEVYVDNNMNANAAQLVKVTGQTEPAIAGDTDLLTFQAFTSGNSISGAATSAAGTAIVDTAVYEKQTIVDTGVTPNKTFVLYVRKS